MAAALVASLDGVVGDPADTTISVLDDGLLRGDGVFEAIKLYEGHPFRLDAHLERIAASAGYIDLEFDAEALRAEIDALLEGERREAMLRVVLTRGGRRILLIEQLPDWPETVDIATVTLTPSEILAGAKTISYAQNMQATRIAVSRGAGEAVFVSAAGVVLEAPTSSVFWVGEDGILRTPALELGILDSITRRVVVEGLDVEEGSYEPADLCAAREAFLASTTREIQPIAAVDGSALPPAAGTTAAAARTLVEAVEAERRGE